MFRITLTVVGAALVVLGTLLTVLPGPGLVLVVAGLRLLGKVYPPLNDLADVVARRIPGAGWHYTPHLLVSFAIVTAVVMV